jgi:hypothetical protein
MSIEGCWDVGVIEIIFSAAPAAIVGAQRMILQDVDMQQQPACSQNGREHQSWGFKG